MPPTITASDFARLNEARRLQVERYRTAYFKREKALPRDDDPGVNRQWLRVKLGTLDRCVPVGTLAVWSATFAESAPLSFDLAGPFVTVKRGTSSIKLFTLPVIHDGKGNSFAEGITPITPLSPPVLLTVTPDNALALELPDLAEELKALRAETTSNRKQIAREKAIAKARKMVKDARERLEKATQEAAEAQAVIDSMTPAQAAAFARRCLATRRLYNAALANPQTVPAWLPKVYVREFFNCATQKGDEETRQTAPDYMAYAADLANAQAALAAYKPRMQWPSYADSLAREAGMSLAAWKRANPDRACPIIGPAFDRLKEARNKAFDNLKWFIYHRFGEYCTAQGLPDCLASPDMSQYCQPRAYSRARLWLKAWPALRFDLEGKLTEANAALERAEAMPER